MSKKFALVTIFALAVIITAVSLASPGTVDALTEAQERGRLYESILAQGHSLSLVCITSADECSQLIERSNQNPELRNALLEAKRRGVRVFPTGQVRLLFRAGAVDDGFVLVNTSASDERIISFLTN